MLLYVISKSGDIASLHANAHVILLYSKKLVGKGYDIVFKEIMQCRSHLVPT